MNTFDGKHIEVGKTYYTSNCYEEDNRIELKEHFVLGFSKSVGAIVNKDGNEEYIHGFCSTKEAAYAELSERLTRIDGIKSKETSKDVKKRNKKIAELKKQNEYSNDFLKNWKSYSKLIQMELTILRRKKNLAK